MQYRKSADDLSESEMQTEKFKEKENNPKKILLSAMYAHFLVFSSALWHVQRHEEP